MRFVAAPRHTQAHLGPKSWPFDSQRVCTCLNVIFYLVNSNMLSKSPQTKAHVCLLWEMCTRARVRMHALLMRVVCEIKAIVIIFQSGARLECSQAADRISALNALMSGLQSEFALIRTQETLLVALLGQITSSHWERPDRGRHKQTRTRGWEGSETRASVQNSYCPNLGPRLWCNDS